MKPWFWHFRAGVAALGALAIAPCLAGGLILFSLGLPLSRLKPGLWYDYWQVLDQAAYRPYAARIRFWGSSGLLLPPLLSCGTILALWRKRRALKSPARYVPFDDIATSALKLTTPGAGAILITTRRGRTLAAPDGASVLVSAPFYPEAHAVVVDALKHSTEATLVIDCGGRTFAYARPVRGRAVIRLCPFGGGGAWNPLAGAWGARGLDEGELRELAAVWLPDEGRHDRFIASHARNAFVSLVRVMDDVLQATDGVAVPVAPGDLYRLCAQCRHFASPLEFLQELAVKHDIGPQARHGLGQWLGLGNGGIDIVWRRVIDVLAAFADPDVDAATRGSALTSLAMPHTDIYLDIPDRCRMAAGPLVASAIRQWQAAPGVGASSLLVVHAIDTLPPIAAIVENAPALRCVATTRGIAALHARYGYAADALDRRFALCVVHAPRDEAFAREESEALSAFFAAQNGRRHPPSRPASINDLMSLRMGEQIVLTAPLPTPVICRTLNLSRKPNTAPPHTDHGASMPIPKPLIAFLATLVATSAQAGDASRRALPATVDRDAQEAPMIEAKLGQHRFRFPRNLYYQQTGPDADGGVMLNVQWPSLKPLPLGTDYHDTTEHFLSNVGIDLATVELLTEDEYRTRLRRSIQPTEPGNPQQRSHPVTHLEQRVARKPINGLTPYYVDFAKFKRYYLERHGEHAPPPDPAQNDDWFIDMGADGIPTTVIKCSSHLIQDGARIEHGRIVDALGEGKRSTCQHEFLIPEYRLFVTVDYLRVVMPDWRRIETFVRQTLKAGELH